MKYIYLEDIENVKEPGDYLVMGSGFDLRHFNGQEWKKYTTDEKNAYMDSIFKKIGNRFMIPQLG